MCRKSTTRDLRLYFTSEGSHAQDFYSLKKMHTPRPSLNPGTSDAVASMISTWPPGSTRLKEEVEWLALARPSLPRESTGTYFSGG